MEKKMLNYNTNAKENVKKKMSKEKICTRKKKAKKNMKICATNKRLYKLYIIIMSEGE